MRNLKLGFLLMVLLTFPFNGLSQGHPPTKEAAMVVLEPPPSKLLDKFYPPQADRPVLFLEMLKMESLYTAISFNAENGDWERAQQSYAAFRDQLEKIFKMVPPWKGNIKAKAVEDLGQAVKAKDLKAVLQVKKDETGPQVCGSCHNKVRNSVWYRYQWKDFSKVMVEDPAAKRKLPLFPFMLAFADSFTGIEIALEQGQPDLAKKSFELFRARLDSLKQGCEACHDPSREERKYLFLAAGAKAADALGAELSQPKVDKPKALELRMGIGQQLCKPCHLVHVPAATVQHLWAGGQR